MNTKNLLVSLLTIVSVLLLAMTVSATSDGYTTGVAVNQVYAPYASVVAGETIQIEIWVTATFTDVDYDRDVTVEAELDTGKEDVKAISDPMVFEAGDMKKVTLKLKVPYELKDELSDSAVLTITVDGKEHNHIESFEINVERAAYNTEIKSVTVSQSVDAGESLPVDVVLKNIGYLDLDDVYVTARIPALAVEQTTYFGDLVSIECDDDDNCDEDDKDSASGRLMLKVPYSAEAGVYTLEVEVSNDDSTNTVVKQIVIKNDFSNNVIVSSSEKSVAVGEDATYELLIVNPTDKVKIYRLVTSNAADLSISGDAIIAISAGSSKAVQVTASADTEGEYNFDVNVFSGEELVQTVTLSLDAKGKAVADLTVVLTVILAIIFIVLLVVLIVLIGKKPAAKAEEFGESYY